MLTMNDIIREGNPRLREVVKEVAIPLTEEDKKIGEEMLEFLINSQDPELAEKYDLRAGVGLAAPQINLDKRIIAVHIPDYAEEGEDERDLPPLFSDILYNPKVLSHSVQEACLQDGEGCLSVDREVPGYVVRPQRITITYTDRNGTLQKRRFKDYEAIVVQHEIDHLNGIMFYDHIQEGQPFHLPEGVTVL